MDTSTSLDHAGPFDARYLAFLETIRLLRPKLHRYCARMTGSVLDGEDVVQEALFHAYRRLDSYDERRPLEPWLFQIAHNRCIDLLRRRGVREEAEAAAAASPVVLPDDPPGPALGRAVEHLVIALPPMERACVLLKDVLDYSLEETADLVGSSVGAVKAALSRGRGKLARLPRGAPDARPAMPPESARLLGLYVERFSRRDWDGLRELIAADARLRVVDRFAGTFAESGYFGRYDRYQAEWRLVLGAVDGESVGVGLVRRAGGWTPAWAVRLREAGGRIVEIVDYNHCPWVIDDATSVVLADAS